MRALYYPLLVEEQRYSIEGEALHHLVNVVRLQVGEELLLLDGKGTGIVTQVENLSKRQLNLAFKEKRTPKQLPQYDLALGIPKRDALDLTLKQATELGFRRIYLVRAEYSQIKVPESERIQNLLISALEQANSFYLPECREVTWETLPWNDYGTIWLMDSQTDSQKNVTSSLKSQLLLVGPEGGFSPREFEFFYGHQNVQKLLLPTPLLRTPTAVAAGAGVLLKKLMD